MFSGIKMEEFMEFEHSGIFRVELVTKNVVLGFLWTHFMHMRVRDRIKTFDQNKIANGFTKYFTAIGSKLASSILKI